MAKIQSKVLKKLIGGDAINESNCFNCYGGGILRQKQLQYG